MKKKFGPLKKYEVVFVKHSKAIVVVEADNKQEADDIASGKIFTESEEVDIEEGTFQLSSISLLKQLE